MHYHAGSGGTDPANLYRKLIFMVKIYMIYYAAQLLPWVLQTKFRFSFNFFDFGQTNLNITSI